MNWQASISFSLAFLLPKYTLWLDLEGAEGEARPSPFFSEIACSKKFSIESFLKALNLLVSTQSYF